MRHMMDIRINGQPIQAVVLKPAPEPVRPEPPSQAVKKERKNVES